MSGCRFFDLKKKVKREDPQKFSLQARNLRYLLATDPAIMRTGDFSPLSTSDALFGESWVSMLLVLYIHRTVRAFPHLLVHNFDDVQDEGLIFVLEDHDGVFRRTCFADLLEPCKSRNDFVPLLILVQFSFREEAFEKRQGYDLDCLQDFYTALGLCCSCCTWLSRTARLSDNLIPATHEALATSFWRTFRPARAKDAASSSL